MSLRYLRLDPETVRLLDRCIDRAQHEALKVASDGVDEATRTRLASALVEAIGRGEREEEQLVTFALQVLPAYREGPFGPPAERAPASASPVAGR